jgi:calcium-dependent protein kinase
LNEAKIVRGCDHPNIVKYYETYDDTSYIYLVMELCSGGDLFDNIINKGSAMSESEASLIINKLMKALNYCHSNDIMHRDIKPQNIVIGDDGEFKLVDFGFAKV